MITPAPWWLLLTTLALLPWFGPWRGRDTAQNIVRSLLWIALAAAMTRPLLVQDDAPVQRVLILDRTASVDRTARDLMIDKSLQFAEGGLRVNSHLIVFGSLDESRDKLERAFGSVSILSSSGPEGTTPLPAALTRAETLIPRTSTGTITLASDGLSTRPDDSRAIAALRERGIPVHVIPVPTKRTAPTPVGISWTNDLRAGSIARLNATVVAHGGGPTGHVVLRTNDGILATGIYSGQPREKVALSFEPKESGFLEAELVVSCGDPITDQILPLVLPVKKPHQVLYIGSLQQNAASQLSKLLGPGFAITEVDLSDTMAVNSALTTIDLVMIDDRPAEMVPLEVEHRIVDAVINEGLGLVMSGGRAAFGTGGWHNRPIESLLPVELIQKEEKRDPSTSLVIVIDTSGSMSGVRVQLAKEVARLAMRRLLPHDKVGIVEFFGAKRWAAPIQPASNAIELQRALNRMDAGGGTVILPALEEAFYGLQNVDTRYKHVLVLTDGGVESGDFESLMRRMSTKGINVSTVLAGGGYHSEFLVNIANWGKGRFYNVPNRFNLPEVLLKQPSTAKLPAYRPGVHNLRARGGPGWWGEVDTTSLPELGGYVETKLKPGGELLLETIAGEHPILTTWRYGLGRVTALCTEPVGPGTKPWKDWDEYGKAIARMLERSAADTRDPFRFEVEHDGGEVLLHAIRQRPRSGSLNDAVPVARLHTQDNIGQQTDDSSVLFVPRSPNRFIAYLPSPPAGETLRLEASASTTPDRSEPIAAPSPVAREDQVDPKHELDLAKLSSVAGGNVLSIDSDWMGPTTSRRGRHLIPLSPWFFGLALVLFFFEILWRRRPINVA